MNSKDNELYSFTGNSIYETRSFVLVLPKTPHISRNDGGHLYIQGKKQYFNSRSDLTPKLATEMIRLTMLSGKAMMIAMNNRGIKVERINYQENGNWSYLRNEKPVFHIHLYGRTINSKQQTWGEALVLPDPKSGFYDNFEPLNNEDIEEILKQITILEKTPKYRLENWNLK